MEPVTTLHLPEPTFTTARGVLAGWIDVDRQFNAFAHYKRQRSQHTLESPDMPAIWEVEQPPVIEVRVRFPDRSITAPRPAGATDPVRYATVIANPRYTVNQSRHPFGARGPITTVSANRGYGRDDLDAYCYHSHPLEALALLQPRCFIHGRDPRGTPVPITVLDRPAEVMPLQRTIPLSNPRILGDQFNPTVFDEAEETEVILDRERGVILEWRALFDGTPYERHFFTEIHFDEPIDEAEFDPFPNWPP